MTMLLKYYQDIFQRFWHIVQLHRLFPPLKEEDFKLVAASTEEQPVGAAGMESNRHTDGLEEVITGACG